MKRIFIFLIAVLILSGVSCKKIGKKEETPDLKVKVSTLASEIKGIGDYKPRQNNIYTPGDEVLLYAEVEGFWFKKSEKGYEYWAIASLSLYDEDGNLVHTKEIVNQHSFYKEPLPSLSFKARLILGPNLPEGKYTLVLYFMDGLSKKSVEVEQPIIVKIRKGEAK